MLLSKLRRSLPGSKWKGETFEGLDLRHALMGLAQFEDCTFRDVKLSRARMPDSTFIRCSFDGCDLTQAEMIARFYECKFTDCNLDQAVLRGADIRETTFRGGRAEYADLTAATMLGGGFLNVNMHGARLEFAQTDNVDFRGSSLWGAVIPISCALLVGNTFDERQIECLFALICGHSTFNGAAGLYSRLSPRYKALVNRIVRSQGDEAKAKEGGEVVEASALFGGEAAPGVDVEEGGLRDKSDFPGKAYSDTDHF